MGAAAQTLDYLFGSFRQELFIAQLSLIVRELFFNFIQLFDQTLALGREVDLSFVDHMDIETRGAARAGTLGEGAVYNRDLFYVRQPLHCAAILLDHGANSWLLRKYLDRHLYFGLDLQFRANIPHVNDQILQDRHLR